MIIPINVYIYKKNKTPGDEAIYEKMKTYFNLYKQEKKTIRTIDLIGYLEFNDFESQPTQKYTFESIRKDGGICFTNVNIEITICLSEKDKNKITWRDSFVINNVNAYTTRERKEKAE